MNQIDINKLKVNFALLKNIKAQKEKELSSLDQKKEKLSKQHKILEEATICISEAVKNTHESLSINLTPIINTCLESTLDEPYTFEAVLNSRGKQTKTSEIKFIIKKNNVVIDSMLSGCGGGVCNIISFCLRLSLLLLKSDKRKLFILDEPFNNLSSISEDNETGYQERLFNSLKTLAQKFQLQMIVVTHETALNDFSDNIINL